MLFEKIIGNEKNKTNLTNIKEPAHAYMFLGAEGIGKLLFAKDFAKKWLCNDADRPCGRCKLCIQFENGNNIDFQIIEPEENSIKIEQIRNMVDKIFEKPVSNKKIYIIDNADKMTTQAQNCLLKVLEEPPTYALIILVASNENAFLNTIKSRCVKIQFQNISNEEIEKYLKETQGIANVSKEMISIYNGSIGKALELIGQEEKYDKIINLVNSLNEFTKVEFIKSTSILTEEKENIINTLDYMIILLYNKAKNETKYLDCIEIINIAIQKINRNCNLEMVLDNMMIEIWEVVNEKYSRS